MALPTKAISAVEAARRSPLTIYFDPTDANPVSTLVGPNGENLGVVFNLASLLDDAGKLDVANSLAAGSVVAAAIGAGAVSGDKLATGVLHTDLLAGQDGGADATYDLTGGALGDEVVFVGHITTAAAIATLADVSADFSFTADDELTDGGATDYTNDQLLVIWIDKTP